MRYASAMQHASAQLPPIDRAQPSLSAEQEGMLVAAAVAIVYLALSLRFTHFRGAFELDPDEGNNLIKALLLERGHKFLTEIWSDQPPLSSYALWAAFKLFGAKVGVARQLILISSAALVFALYDGVLLILRGKGERVAAHAAAAIATLCLLFGSSFAVLRVSVMIGMPSVACATLALWAALHAGSAEKPRSRYAWVAASGALMALSIAVKLFTAYLLPVVAGTALAAEALALVRKRDNRLLLLTVTFGGAFAVVLLLALLPALASGHAAELVATHLESREVGYRSRHTVASFITQDGAIFALAAVGAVLSLVRKNWRALAFVAWLALSVGALSMHNPLWAHHNQLLLIPGAALAGIAIGSVAGFVPARLRLASTLVIAVASAGLLLALLSSRAERFITPQTRDETRDRRALEFLRSVASNTGYMVSARPIFAFYLGLPVPPNLSVTSAKRFRARRLDADTIWADIRQRDVTLVLLSKRWTNAITDRLREHLSSGYRLVYRDAKNGGLEVYQRQAADAPAPAAE